MYTETITYVNYNGEKVTKKFYFNISKAELALRELESDGTWSETLEKIANSNKGSVVLPEFKKIIRWTYGEKSADGESFEKSDEIWNRFENSEPWSILVMKLLSDADYSAHFINSCLPADMSRKNLEASKKNGFRPGADTSRPVPPAAKHAVVDISSKEEIDEDRAPVGLTDEPLPLIKENLPSNPPDDYNPETN